MLAEPIGFEPGRCNGYRPGHRGRGSVVDRPYAAFGVAVRSAERPGYGAERVLSDATTARPKPVRVSDDHPRLADVLGGTVAGPER